MSRINITFGTPTCPEFKWLDSFECLEEEEIEGLIVILRGASAAFSAELSDRREPWRDQTLEDYKKKLQRTTKQINNRGLTQTHAEYLDGLDSSLAQADCAQNKRSKAAMQYLWLISNVIGWPYALLIFCALGKHKVEHLNEYQQVKLVRYIAEHWESLFCRKLEDRAIQSRCQKNHIKADLSLTRGSKKRKSRESADSAMSIEPALNRQHHPYIFANNPRSDGTVYFNQQLAQPVINPIIAPNIMVSGPEEYSMEAASIPRDCDRTSFLQVEPELRDAHTLLRLLCFLDGASIPEFMLIRAKVPQKSWSPSGEIQKVPVTQVGLNSDVLSLLSDDVKIEEAIKRLEVAMLITSKPGAYGRRTLHIDSATQLRQTQRLADPLAWRLQALIFVCHTFPMHPYLEPLYGPLGRLQIHQVQCVMNHYPWRGTPLSPPTKRKVAEVLLAASYFLDVSWKSKALDAVKAITADEPAGYLQTWVNLRECTLAGLEIGNEIKGLAIHSAGHGQIDARSNALFGQLILSNALSSIRRHTLDHARSVLDQFSPVGRDRPSTMERLVLNKMEVTVGKIDRYQGKFQLARGHLSSPPDADASLDGVAGRSPMSHLACVLCELGEPLQAQALLYDEIRIMEKLGLQDISSGRCLRLSLAEALLQQELLKEAEDVYLGLREVLEDCPNPNLPRGIEKLRLWMGLARISHLQHSWSDALIKWEKALSVSEDCNWKAGFNEMVVRYSISHVKFMLGEREHSDSQIKRADDLYRREGRQFWLTGLGTYWLDFVWHSLGHKPEIL